MNKLKGSLIAKSIAVILFCALCLSFALSALAVGMLYSAGFYGKGAAAAREHLAQSLCADEGQRIAWFYPGDGAENAQLTSNDNYRYEVYDVNGVLRLSNYNGEAVLATAVIPCSFWYSYNEAAYGTLWGEEENAAPSIPLPPAGETTQPDTQTEEPLPTPTPTQHEEAFPIAEVTPTPRVAPPGDIDYESRGRTVHFTLKCFLLRDMTQRDSAAFQLGCFDFAAANDQLLIGAAAACLLLAIAVFIFLLRAAGHRRDTDEIRASFIEKIPFDLFTALIAASTAAALLFVLGARIFLLWCVSLAVRVKQKTLIRGTILYKLLRLIGRVLRELWSWLKTLALSLPLVWRGVLFYLAFAFVGQLLMIASDRSAPVLWFLGCLVLFPAVVWLLISARRLRAGAKELAGGNTQYRERMKTELITNVSHDIKTPLTSIISYVDLLSKEEIENEQAREYIEVLRRQSARLKKLTDDLVEASKASSGVLAVTIEDCDLSVMLDQTAGEYGEKLAEKNLELVLRKPEKEVRARADARHTQRIFDNLMSNILKYALPGTRVYLELKEDENGPAVIFRNTSRSEIVQSPEELTERFVRGDASRSSEGSGLGLSIARSLAELQGGSLAVTVDGDLFKVTLGFAGR